MPFLTVLGAKTFYAHRRPLSVEGPPVVLIHGAGGSHQHWLHQVRDLPRSAAYALDLPGHGQSEGPGRDSILAYGDWLVAFLDEAGLERVVLAGHSMGGGISLDVALRYPARVVGLGLVGTGGRLRVNPAILEGVLQNFEAAVKLICDFAFGPEAPPEMSRLGRLQMAETPPDVLHGDLCACDAFDVIGRLGEIAAPAVAVCGTEDRLTPVKYSTYLRDHIAGADLYLVEGAGHMVMVEKPQAVIEALTGLLDKVGDL